MWMLCSRHLPGLCSCTLLNILMLCPALTLASVPTMANILLDRLRCLSCKKNKFSEKPWINSSTHTLDGGSFAIDVSEALLSQQPPSLLLDEGELIRLRWTHISAISIANYIDYDSRGAVECKVQNRSPILIETWLKVTKQKFKKTLVVLSRGQCTSATEPNWIDKMFHHLQYHVKKWFEYLVYLWEMLSHIIHCETLRGQVAHVNLCRRPCGIPRSAPLIWTTMNVAFLSCLCKKLFSVIFDLKIQI